jgi:hypothetical protein
MADYKAPKERLEPFCGWARQHFRRCRSGIRQSTVPVLVLAAMAAPPME